jgi:hypothetical protein
MIPIIPDRNQPLVDNRGLVTQIWQQFFNALRPSVDAISALVVSASPTSFTASQRGTVAVSGGTLTAVSLLRGSTTVALGTSRVIPVSNGDIVRVTYTVAPTMSFIPN